MHRRLHQNLAVELISRILIPLVSAKALRVVDIKGAVSGIPFSKVNNYEFTHISMYQLV